MQTVYRRQMDSKWDNDKSQVQTQAINEKYERKGKIRNVMLRSNVKY